MNLFRAMLFVGALVVLAACGLVSVPIEDPFGLDGETMTATVDSSEIRVQVPSSAFGNVSGSIDDSSDATGTLTNTVTFEADVVVTKDTGNTNAYPPTITVERVDVSVSIDDGTTDAVTASGTINDDFVMTRSGDCPDTTAPCNYTMPVPAGVSISLPIGTVLNNDVSPNAVSASVELSLDSTPGLQGGDTLQFILEASEGSGSL